MTPLLARIWPTRNPAADPLAGICFPIACPLCGKPVPVAARHRLITVGLASEGFTPRRRIAHASCRRPARGVRPRLVRHTATPEPSRGQLWLDVALAAIVATVLAGIPTLVLWTDGYLTHP